MTSTNGPGGGPERNRKKNATRLRTRPRFLLLSRARRRGPGTKSWDRLRRQGRVCCQDGFFIPPNRSWAVSGQAVHFQPRGTRPFPFSFVGKKKKSSLRDSISYRRRGRRRQFTRCSTRHSRGGVREVHRRQKSYTTPTHIPVGLGWTGPSFVLPGSDDTGSSAWPPIPIIRRWFHAIRRPAGSRQGARGRGYRAVP